MAIEYRMMNLNSSADIQQWRDLYTISFNKSISVDEWRWKFIQNPFGNAMKSPTYVATSDNLIIGSLSLLPMQFYLSTHDTRKTIPAGLLTTGIVHPDFRKRGIFSKLLSHIVEDATIDGLGVLYGYAVNEYAAKTLSRHSWREVPGYKSYSLYLNVQQRFCNILSTIHSPGFLKSMTNLVPSSQFFFRRSGKENNQFQFSCGNVEELLFDIEKTYCPYPDQNKISGVRNLRALRWLFGCPGITYLCFSMRSGEELLAYIIVRQQKKDHRDLNRTAIIEDSFAKRGKNSLDSRLLPYMIDQLRRHHFTKISTYFFRRGLLDSFPLHNGFVYRPDNTRFLYYPVPGCGLSDEIWNRIVWDIHLAEKTPI